MAFGRIVLGLLLLALVGCASPLELFRLVVPGQHTLDIRPPVRIPHEPLPQLPSPPTVSKPAPEVAPQNLSLDEAIRISLANSQVVRILTGTSATTSGKTIYDPAVSNTNIDVARADFDPVITAKNAFHRIETPNAVFSAISPTGVDITGTRIDNYELGLGMTKKFVTGANLGVDYALTDSRFRSSASAINPLFQGVGPAPLNPQARSNLTLSLTQPLMQGAGIAPNVAPIVLARINTERSFFQFKDAMQDMVRGVIEAYWQIVFARTDVWARRQQVEQGTAAYNRAEARRKQGFGTAAEVAQTKVALSNFRATLIGAEANLLQREAALRNILGLPPTEPERLVPTTPPTPERLEPRWDEIVRLAELMRPDLIELNLILEADQQTLIQARNNARPQLDATGFFRWNGLEGETPTGARLSTSPGQYSEWNVGLNFSVPLGLRQGRAQLRNAELLIMTDRANLDQGRHNTIHILAGNLRNLAQYYEQYLAFRQTRIAARINLEQQAAEFRAGRAIFLNVLQAITDWGNAVSSEAQSLSQYNIELANLERQTGTILETHGVHFFEERFLSMGPLGPHGRKRPFPAAMPPGPNEQRYPDTGEPADKNLENEIPSLKMPAAAPSKLPPPKLSTPKLSTPNLPNAASGRKGEPGRLPAELPPALPAAEGLPASAISLGAPVLASPVVQSPSNASNVGPRQEE